MIRYNTPKDRHHTGNCRITVTTVQYINLIGLFSTAMWNKLCLFNAMYSTNSEISNTGEYLYF